MTVNGGTGTCSILMAVLSLSLISSKEPFHLMLDSMEDSKNASELTRQQRSVQHVIYIGIILDGASSVRETPFRRGIEAANVVLRGSETLRQHQLEPIFVNVSPENIFLGMQQVCKILNRGIIALYGPRDLTLSRALLSLANRFGIPYIEDHWSLKTPSGGYSIGMYPGMQTYGLGLYEYVSQVEKWRRMTIIEGESRTLEKFANLVNHYEGELSIKRWDSGSAAARALIAELSSGLDKNFLVDIPAWQIRDFLVMAFLHNMTGFQYTFIFTDWDAASMDLSPFKVGVGARIKTMSIIQRPNTAVQPGSAMTTKPLGDKTSLFTDVAAGLKFEFNTDSAIIHDSLLLLAHGLSTLTRTRYLLPHKFSCERPPGLWALGLSLLNAMKSAPPEKIKAITGHFRFDRSGLRTLFDLTILDLTEGGFVPTAVWNIDERMKVAKPVVVPVTKKVTRSKSVVLKVTTKDDPPFMIVNGWDAYGKPLTSPDAWKGYCIDLLNRIAEEVGFNYTVHLTPDKSYGSGKDYGNGTIIYDGIMGELIRGEVDMAVAGFTITYEREKLVDFSTPWMRIGGSILFTKPKSQKPSLFSFMQPLSPQVWLYVVTIYVAVCLCMFVAARMTPHEWRASHPCEENADLKKNQFTLLNSFYYYLSAILNQGTELAPQATSTRMLTGIWWFFSLIIIATYTANLAAFLTVENTKSPIESAADLVNQVKIKYGTLSSGSSRDFFSTSKIEIFQRMGQFMQKNPQYLVNNTPDGVARVLQGNYAFIMESSWNEYYVQRNCQLMQVGDLLDSKGYGIGFPQGSVWRDRISQAILKLQNQQVLAELKRHWWNEYNISEPCSLLKESGKSPSPLGVEQVGGVFILLLFGFVVGFVVAVVEFIIATRDQEKAVILKAMWRELKFATRCLTTSKRLKSEVHKLPRSRSNLHLVGSDGSNLMNLETKTSYGPQSSCNNGYQRNAESREPLISAPNRLVPIHDHQPITFLPMNLTSENVGQLSTPGYPISNEMSGWLDRGLPGQATKRSMGVIQTTTADNEI